MRLLVIVLALHLWAPSASGRIIIVAQGDPVGFTLIQEAISAATHGDTIVVHSGLYNEHLDFLGKDIVLLSQLGPVATTIQGFLPDSAVVTFQSGESRDAKLIGFTITGGTNGGVLIINAEPTIQGSTITGNRNEGCGAGICVASVSGPTSPAILGNVITDNTTEGNGGGIGLVNFTCPLVEGNLVALNHAGLDGGGIWINVIANDTVVRQNLILNNHAGDHGGGLYFGISFPPTEVSADISWNLIAENRAVGVANTGDSGGGLWIAQTNAIVEQNTIVANVGLGGEGAGGGIVIDGLTGSPVVRRNIIALSRAGGGVFCYARTAATFRDNLFWSNTGGEVLGSCVADFLTDGNIIADPLFCSVGATLWVPAENSPAFTHAMGPIGYVKAPGCAATSVVATSWSGIKLRAARFSQDSIWRER